MSRWPIPAIIQQDESISSYLARVALKHGCDPIVLTGWLWPGWRAWTFDLDRGLPRDKLNVLAKCSGLDKLSIEAAGLTSAAAKFSKRDLSMHGVWPWVQALGARNRLYRGGIQFCPQCLLSDQNPYYRRHWRYSWVTCCLVHSTMMVDSCSECGRPIEPHRLIAFNADSLAQCASCGSNFLKSSTLFVSSEFMCFQRLAQSTLSENGGNIAGELVCTPEWFDACRHLLILIRRSTSAPQSTLALALREVCPAFINVRSEMLNLQLELLGVEVRAELLIVLHGLLTNLNEFGLSLARCGALSTCLVDKGGRIPLSLRFLAEGLKDPIRRNYGDRIHQRLQPKSKAAVLKSWARLRRKYRFE